MAGKGGEQAFMALPAFIKDLAGTRRRLVANPEKRDMRMLRSLASRLLQNSNFRRKLIATRPPLSSKHKKLPSFSYKSENAEHISHH